MIRVLRLLEYEFESSEAAKDHMQRFQVPASGEVKFGNYVVVRSAIITDLKSRDKDD